MSLPVEACESDCLPLSDVQGRTTTHNGVTQRFAYSLQEFIDNYVDGSFDRSTANTECIVGIYARYALGYSEDNEANGDDPWMILISHPYSQADAQPILIESSRALLDKAEQFPSTLREMCFEPRESGWVSIANWGSLDPILEEDGIRFTNDNFSDGGRITQGGEYLQEGSPTEEFIADPSTFDAIFSAGLDISSLFGPNFPTPGFDAGVYSSLVTLLENEWTSDANPEENFGAALVYYQDLEAREAFRTRVIDGQLTGADNAPIDVRDGDVMAYIIDCMGRMYAHKTTDPARAVTAHSQFLGGGAVAAAGELYADNGAVTHVNLRSGHYQPGPEFLIRIQEQFPDVEFEEAYNTPFSDFYQSWICDPIITTAPKNGASEGSFGPTRQFEGQWLYARRFELPERIPVTLSGTSGTLSIRFELLFEEGRQRRRVLYGPNASDQDHYYYQSGDYQPGELVFFTSFTMKVDGGSGGGSAELIIDNCEADGCFTLDELRELERETLADLDPNLALLFDEDDGIPIPGNEKRLAYTLEEYLTFNFPDRVANSECVPGQYSRYVIGEKDDDPNEKIMLISQPYSESDLTGEAPFFFIPDKTRYFESLLSVMCYEQIDAGWVSLAEWHNLSPSLLPDGFPNDHLSFRMTNRNYSDGSLSRLGRITEGSEYLEAGSEADQFFQENREIISVIANPVELIGPNFPTPEFDVPSVGPLTQMISGLWPDDVRRNRAYSIDPQNREPVALENGIISRDGSLVTKDSFTSYIVDCRGTFYIPVTGTKKHSQFLGGAAIATGGEIKADDGRILYLDNDSGHYFPPCTSLERILNRYNLIEEGFMEEPFTDFPDDPICRSWACESIPLEAGFDDQPVSFTVREAGSPLTDPAYRSILLPSELFVIGGMAPVNSRVNLELFNLPPENFTYIPDPDDATRYILAPGQAPAGTKFLYSRATLRTENGGGVAGQVRVELRNCSPSAFGSSSFGSSDVITATVTDDVPLLISKAYPNPANEHLSVEIHGIKDVRLVNLKGQIHLPDWRYLTSDQAQIDVSGYAPGLYTLVIVTRHTEFYEKILVGK